jgi:hypothetical protein
MSSELKKAKCNCARRGIKDSKEDLTMATLNTPVLPDHTFEHQAMSAPAPLDVRAVTAPFRLCYHFILVSHTLIAAAVSVRACGACILAGAPLPAFTTDPLHHQDAPIRYTISNLILASFRRTLAFQEDLVDVNTHTRACPSQLAACVSCCHLPLPVCLHALCIIKIMLLLVDSARWMNDVVAARCVCARYSYHHDWQCAHPSSVIQNSV